MNHLAHALLAGDDDATRLGGMLGDFVHGRPDPALPAGVIAGIALHRSIDSFTDTHPEVLAAKALLQPPYRRYAGILVDIWFDYCLGRDFARWSEIPLERFSNDVRALMHRHPALLPPRLQDFLQYMDAHDLPAGYRNPAMIEQALVGVGQRLSRANPLASAMAPLRALDEPLQQHFEVFFPQLVTFAAGWVEARAADALAPPGSGLG